MPVLSIIPFVLHLMTPISLELQAAGILQSNFTAYPLTPIKSSLADSRLILTTKLGKAGELPVPLFAELERSMSNMVRIYHQYKDESHVIKKTYFYTENCNGDLLLTEDKVKASLFQIRNEDDDLHGSNFHISCLSEEMEGSGDGAVPTKTWRKLSLSTHLDNHQSSLKLGFEDKTDNSKYFSLIGMITPYYMQNK